MTAEIRSWLEAQAAANDPATAGDAGALHLAQSVAALMSGEGMAFGLVIADERTRELGERVRETLRAWIAEGGRRRYDDLVEGLGSSGPLSDVGIDAPPQDPIVARIRFELAASTQVDVPDGSIVPRAWAALRDSPCFEEHHEWIADAQIVMRGRGDALVAELTLLCRVAPAASTVDRLADELADLGAGELFVEAPDGRQEIVDVAFDEIVGRTRVG